MHVNFQCDRRTIGLEVPDDSIVYESHFDPPAIAAKQIVQEAIARPMGGPALAEAIQGRRDREGDVVVVISDITRPIPYATFLGTVLQTIERSGVRREQILILIATGMHRPSTADERRQMVGEAIASSYRFEDHDSAAPDLVELPEKSRSGNTIRLNRRFMQAGFRITTGLVEPHFMVGFSGGRKAVFPGLTSPEAVRKFHGYAFLSDPRATNGVLEGNPCHLEAVSAANQAGVEFSLNVVMNRERDVVQAFAGNIERAHEAACAFARSCVCRPVQRLVDVLITSGGGYPLDATFYQSVKGFVSPLVALKPGGTIIAFAGCREGIGSKDYSQTMMTYSGRWRDFLKDIAATDQVVKDQWQMQMHCRALAKVGQENLHFFTPGLSADVLAKLSVTPHAVSEAELPARLQEFIDQSIKGGKTVAVLPEGPYCAPIDG